MVNTPKFALESSLNCSIDLPVSARQRHTRPSEPQEANSLPLGEKQTSMQVLEWASIVCRSLPDFTSQTWRRPTAAVTSILPSDENVAATDWPSCSPQCNCLHVCVSQMRTLRSLPTEAASVPSFESVTQAQPEIGRAHV